MARLKGETVTRITREVETDWSGRETVISETRENFNAVVTTGSYKLQAAGIGVGFVETGSLVLLFLDFVEVARGDIFEIRGHEWEAEGDKFDHRSPFGTTRGGTEITVKRKGVTNT